MASHIKHAIPKQPVVQRPPLPKAHLNPLIIALEPSKVPPVKFQEIVRDGQATVVARMKIPTPSGHAFILRRLDTGAISLTTMFRTAFPTAPEDVERKEAAWVKATYDTTGANKSGKARFAGTWVTPEVALEIAKDYNLEPVIAPLALAQPDPNMVYRKSQKTTQQPTPAASPVVTQVSVAPRDAAPPAKRRREASPAANPPAETGTTPARRSTRLRSPQPTTPSVAKSPLKTPKTVKAVHEHLTSITVGSDETVVEEEDTEVIKVAQPNMEEDVREQRELVERLKAERSAAEASQMLGEGSQQSVMQKREREDQHAELKLNIKEPENEERALVTNSRIRVLQQMPPERKQLAWGTLLFAVGVSAVTFLPSLPSLSSFF